MLHLNRHTNTVYKRAEAFHCTEQFKYSAIRDISDNLCTVCQTAVTFIDELHCFAISLLQSADLFSTHNIKMCSCFFRVSRCHWSCHSVLLLPFYFIYIYGSTDFLPDTREKL